MFCRKKCTMWDVIAKLTVIAMTVIGTLTVAGVILRRAGKLTGKAKHLAAECGKAVGCAASSLANAMENCTCDENGSREDSGACGCGNTDE